MRQERESSVRRRARESDAPVALSARSLSPSPGESSEGDPEKPTAEPFILPGAVPQSHRCDAAKPEASNLSQPMRRDRESCFFFLPSLNVLYYISFC